MKKNKPTKAFDLNIVYDKALKFLFISPVLVFLIALLIIKLFEFSDLSFFKVGDTPSWISFAGSIVGGLVTMLAVMTTLKFEENRRQIEKAEFDEQRKLEKDEYEQQRRHDKAIAILPVIQLRTTTSHNDHQEGLHRFHEFIVENVSVNHVCELLLSSINVCWLEPSKEHPGSYDRIYSSENYFDENTVHLSLLPSKTNYKFRVYLHEPNEMDLVKSIRNPGTNCLISFSLQYKDILGIYKYTHDYKLILEQVVDPTLMVYADGHLITPYQFYNETNEFEIQ